MPTKRHVLMHRRKPRITTEMVSLFARGLALIKGRKRNSDEFRQIDKRLNWTLLHRVGDVSVFNAALDGPMPDYMQWLASGRTWDAGVRIRQALQEAVRLGAGGSPPD
jgi:hypothetical protein